MDGLTIIVCIILHYLVDLKPMKYRNTGYKVGRVDLIWTYVQNFVGFFLMLS